MKSSINKFSPNNSNLWNNLPLYIKIGSIYYFLIALITLFLIIGEASSMIPNTSIALYGISAKALVSTFGMYLFYIYVFKAFVAYSLYKGKDFSIMIAYIDALLGISICAFVFFQPFIIGKEIFYHRLSFEILYLIPYATYTGRLLFMKKSF